MQPLAKAPLPQDARYVALGSSFAAGPGIDPAERPRTRCARSMLNYAHQLAARRRLTLVDVSCGGATTAHLLGPWNELPPQLDSVTADTRLVTVTIGGNDVGYVGRLFGASCRASATNPSVCPRLPEPSDEDWEKLHASMKRIATEVKYRAPLARLIFVDYVTLLPEEGSCQATPMGSEDAGKMRAVARRLADLTAQAAQEAGAEILSAWALSRNHTPCQPEPWAAGVPYKGGPKVLAAYHPTLLGMTAIADALDDMLRYSPSTKPGKSASK
ncbi:SGNH/GDSL hydrolase family protein [Sphingobium tyrosinilyticum]|uniref:SGNH/GDSL hydrolase family protein n=1 Tax=Sphingobium tyrosinilyticum TaxID=2715436 RepID=A0ABV9F3F8_9SPHN